MWEKQVNVARHRRAPDDVMCFSTYRITIGRAAELRYRLRDFHSADILLDLGARPPKLGIQFHKNGKGEFSIAGHKCRKPARVPLLEIPCGSALARIRRAGFGPGRYHFRADQPEFFVFDLDLPTTPVGGVTRNA